jgi:thiosulfate/3-mercaptopyruvate sulfurtransferase
MKRRAFLFGTLAATVVGCQRTTAGDDAPLGPLVSTSAIAGRLGDVKSGKLVVLYVGPDMLFSRGRIPGAKNVGEAGTDEGRRALKEALAALAPGTEAVVYCGCCPVRSCPNVRPASAEIRASKANAHLLDLPTRFTTDWADKGLPVERG